MSVKKLLLLPLLFSLLAVGSYLVFIQAAQAYGKFPSPSLTSDVLVTTELDWWNANDDLEITTFEARAIGDVSRGMLNSRQPFVIEFHIAGTARSSEQNPQCIDSVFVSDRFGESKEGERWVDIQVQPRTDLNSSQPSVGKSQPFDVRVQRAYRTYQWGPNKYRAVCQGLSSTVTIQQSK